MAEGDIPALAGDPPGISEEALKKAEEFIEADEGAINRLTGTAGNVATTVAVVMSLFHLYAAIAGAWPFGDAPIIATQPLRYAHVAFVLVLSFLLFPMAMRFRNRIRWWDVVLGLTGAAHPDLRHRGRRGFHRPRHLADRSSTPMLGVIFIVLLLEATRRTTGWIVPVIALCFIAYAYFGPYLPQPWTHRGFDIGQLVGHLFITLEGIFGVPVDVSSSLIILFTIYGAFLQHSGAGKFFIDFSMALMGNKAEQRRPHRGAVVVPARRAVGLRRRHHGDDRRGRLSDDGARRLREERRRRIARGRRARRHHLAAGARRRRLPDRRVPQDQLSRRDLDGDHPDLPLLPVAAVHGRARRQALRRAHRRYLAGSVALAAHHAATASTSCR